MTEFLQPTYGPHAATKAALLAFSGVLAKEMRGRNISVNAVAPGPVNTPLFTTGKTPQEIASFARRTPHGRIGEPADIPSLVSALAGPDAYRVNGQTIYTNGGIG